MKKVRILVGYNKDSKLIFNIVSKKDVTVCHRQLSNKSKIAQDLKRDLETVLKCEVTKLYITNEMLETTYKLSLVRVNGSMNYIQYGCDKEITFKNSDLKKPNHVPTTFMISSFGPNRPTILGVNNSKRNIMYRNQFGTLHSKVASHSRFIKSGYEPKQLQQEVKDIRELKVVYQFLNVTHVGSIDDFDILEQCFSKSRHMLEIDSECGVDEYIKKCEILKEYLITEHKNLIDLREYDISTILLSEVFYNDYIVKDERFKDFKFVTITTDVFKKTLTLMKETLSNKSSIMEFINPDGDVDQEGITKAVNDAMEIFGNTVSITDLSSCMQTPLENISVKKKVSLSPCSLDQTENIENTYDMSVLFVIDGSYQVIKLTDLNAIKNKLVLFNFKELDYNITNDRYQSRIRLLNKYIRNDFRIPIEQINWNFILISTDYYTKYIKNNHLFNTVKFINVKSETFYRAREVIKNKLGNTSRFISCGGIKLGEITEMTINKPGDVIESNKDCKYSHSDMLKILKPVLKDLDIELVYLHNPSTPYSLMERYDNCFDICNKSTGQLEYRLYYNGSVTNGFSNVNESIMEYGLEITYAKFYPRSSMLTEKIHETVEKVNEEKTSIKSSIKDILVSYGIEVISITSGSMYNSFILEHRKLKDGVIDGFFNIRFGEPGSINFNEFSVVVLYKGNQPILDNNLVKLLAKDIRLTKPRFEFITHKPE